jgi:hypothetical protein
MSKAVIVHESAIFDKRRARSLSALNTTQFRALKILSTTKKENKHLSDRSLKAERKDLLRHCVYVDFDSNQEHRQEAFATARSIEKDLKFIID